MFALEAKTGKIVWQFFLAPKVEGDVVRGRWANRRSTRSHLEQRAGIPISGAGTWTSYTLDVKNGLLYVPGGNPAPDFASGRARATIYLPTRSSCSTPRPATSRINFKVVKKDWHDWDVSSPPILLQTMGGKQIMSLAPKDGISTATISPPTSCSTACR